MAEGRILKEGAKDDQTKNRLELMPYDAMWELGKVYTMGAKKYEDRNWEKGILYSRVFGAMMRHAWLWWNREENDPESGLGHMVHAAWNALTLVAYILRGMVKWDDRPLPTKELRPGSVIWVSNIYDEMELKEAIEKARSQT